ncbi:hypothetical protein GUJ93_ZPchr0010g11293 [Zizania palustris]|uniref:Uncharacterized protein n=1 Tax=Zizania palustris TaxID=103762 RepID=A0A8J5WBN4_ZIZPA|nr:hypothetical protein GUJ93_ZPchr0010g11293 [Zizania palustris]
MATSTSFGTSVPNEATSTTHSALQLLNEANVTAFGRSSTNDPWLAGWLAPGGGRRSSWRVSRGGLICCRSDRLLA